MAKVIKGIDKDQRYRNNRILASAKGEECHVYGPSCNNDPQTTVWAHSPFRQHGQGWAMKAHDIFGCYSCSNCHDLIDGRGRFVIADDLFIEAMHRSWLTLVRKGILR